MFSGCLSASLSLSLSCVRTCVRAFMHCACIHTCILASMPRQRHSVTGLLLTSSGVSVYFCE